MRHQIASLVKVRNADGDTRKWRQMDLRMALSIAPFMMGSCLMERQKKVSGWDTAVDDGVEKWMDYGGKEERKMRKEL